MRCFSISTRRHVNFARLHAWCRYCIVLFAGIAAEGLVYGEAEGGESDENLYKAIISGLRPPWGPGKVSSLNPCHMFFSASTFIKDTGRRLIGIHFVFILPSVSRFCKFPGVEVAHVFGYPLSI